MKILLTGATGYIGKRLLPILIERGYKVVCGVRDKSSFNPPSSFLKNIEVIQMDLTDEHSLKAIPNDINGAYYLVHSMSSSSNYVEVEQRCAVNFREALAKTMATHVIYLSGMTNVSQLSKHLGSRKNVEKELKKGSYHLTTLRAGIIIGSGSASFEIIRDLVEKLPFMIAPKWLNTKCQSIGISDVLSFLSESLFHSGTYDKDFDIGGQDVLSYKEMLLEFARVRNLNRKIVTVPAMTPRLDKRKSVFEDKEKCIDKIWSIGGATGWYYGNWLWQLRGYLDKLVGGVGLRRGRTNTHSINAGDVLDFWRVLYANKEDGRLLLFAEMSLPGEAWLEFRIKDDL